MTINTRLEQWKEHGIISPEQHVLLDGLSRGEPSSIFLELNVLLYAGIAAFIGGLGWTVTTWSQQLGDIVVLAVLSAILGGCFWYCAKRAPRWSRTEVASPGLAFDYVLYLGSLTWSLELAYIENRLHLMSGQWDVYLLVTAALFFYLAYRYDNRFVLSLALSALAGWFGLTLNRWPSHLGADYRRSAIVYSVLTGSAGFLLQRRGVKAHFFGAYLNIAANVLLAALVAGVFQDRGFGPWLLGLVAACGASLAWGIAHRQFSFVAYAAVYGYVGVSSILLRGMHEETAVLSYFFVTGIAMIVALVVIARRFGREA